LQSEDDINNNDKLWTGFNEGQAGWLLENNLNNANIVQYIWKDAFQHSGKVPEDNGYTEAWQYIPGAGAYLGKELLTALGPDYQESIHFIGHSMGTAVNTYAARLFLNYADQVKSAQFTSLDRPDHIEQIPGFNGLFGDDEEKYRFDSDFFAVNLPTDIEIKIDNYYSLDKNSATGVGDIADYLQGQTVFNHQLTNPHEVGGTFFDGEGTDNDHSGVHQWYRWTIDPNRGYFTNSDGLKVATAFQAGLKLEGDIRGLVQPFCLGNQYFTKLSNLHGSMNPCEYGWNIGSNKLGELFKEDFPKNDGVLLDVTQEQLSLLDFISIGNCEAIGGESSGILCKEGSSSFGMAQIDLPSTAEYLMFDYLSPSIGNDDFITVFLDDIAIWTIGGESVIGGSYVESGYIPIRGLTGSRILTLALNGFG